VSLEKDVYSKYDIILLHLDLLGHRAADRLRQAVTAFAARPCHGLNEIILRSGLSVDYNEVSKQAEKLRLG